MTRALNLQIRFCSQCPYCREDRVKGWGNGVYRCEKTYDAAPNFQGGYRRIGSDEPMYKNRFNGDADFYKEAVPDWCPLPMS